VAAVWMGSAGGIKRGRAASCTEPETRRPTRRRHTLAARLSASGQKSQGSSIHLSPSCVMRCADPVLSRTVEQTNSTYVEDGACDGWMLRKSVCTVVTVEREINQRSMRAPLLLLFF
jgi:hypothetical protein